MVQRGRTKPEAVPRCQDLRLSIESYPVEDNRPLLRKDAHLVEAALARGKRIVSRDERARDEFCSLASAWPPLELFYWAHVGTTEGMNITIEWITDSVPDDDRVALVPVERRKYQIPQSMRLVAVTED